jgi:hypothetical protein
MSRAERKQIRAFRDFSHGVQGLDLKTPFYAQLSQSEIFTEKANLVLFG